MTQDFQMKYYVEMVSSANIYVLVMISDVRFDQHNSDMQYVSQPLPPCKCLPVYKDIQEGKGQKNNHTPKTRRRHVGIKGLC